MLAVYTLLLYAGLLVALPYYAVRFRRYLPTLKHRLGYLELPRLERSIWVHAVSVGEVKAVQRLAEKLRAARPGRPLVISTVTLAGQELARSIPGLADHVLYFPLDLPGAVRRALDRVNPELVLIAETEIWPNFLRECQRRRVPVVLINGRISDRSFPRYRAIRAWLSPILGCYTALGVQTEQDRRRMESIGAPAEKVHVFGNLKYDTAQAARPLAPDLEDQLRLLQPLWIAASTMPGEEALVLDAFAELRPRHRALRLLVAPRHPERFDAVEQLVRERGLGCHRRSGGTMAEPADVFLLDTIGELAPAFRHARVVFMGGTLVERGGHNILEPAAFEKPIVFGPHMENFREIRDLFVNDGASIEIGSAAELAPAVGRVLAEPETSAELGRRAKGVVDRHRGATDRVLAYLRGT
jgi:3-deoxy-D-manno-octulosonic-acid transferase